MWNLALCDRLFEVAVVGLMEVILVPEMMGAVAMEIWEAVVVIVKASVPMAA